MREHADGVRDALFHREPAVCVHFALVLLAVSEASRAADAAVHARHTLDEVGVQHPFGLFEQRRPARLDAVAGDGFIFKVRLALLLDRLRHGVRDAAAPREDPAEVGRIVEGALREVLEVEIRGVEEGLQLLEGDDGVDVRAHLGLLEMNTTRQGEDVLLIYFAMVAAGERFAEMCGAMSGNCFLM